MNTKNNKNLVECEACGILYEYYTEPNEVKEGGINMCQDCWDDAE